MMLQSLRRGFPRFSALVLALLLVGTALPSGGAAAQGEEEPSRPAVGLATGQIDWEGTVDGGSSDVGLSEPESDADMGRSDVGADAGPVDAGSESLVIARDAFGGAPFPSEVVLSAPDPAWQNTAPEVIDAAHEWAAERDSTFLVVCDPATELQYPLASTDSASIVQVKDSALMLRPVEEALEFHNTPYSKDVLFSVRGDAPMGEAETPAVKAFEAVSEADDASAADITPDVVLIDTGAPADCANVVGSISLLPDDDSPIDENGHATAMAEVICAENPDATIYCIKAADASGVGQLSTVYAALEYAIKLEPRTISFSLVARSAQARDVCAPLVDSAAEKGIAVVAAAGNEGRDASGTALGGIGAAVVVGACDETGAKLAVSNWGESVDWYAVGASTSHAAAKVAGILSACDYGELDSADGVFAATYRPTRDEQVVEEATEAVALFVTAANTGPVVGVYRFFQFTISDHYYSTSTSAPSGYTLEGEVWKAPTSSSTPVYQFHWNRGKTIKYDTFYSTSSTSPSSSYTYDGIAFYSDDCKMVPIYRNYLSETNNHLYVTDASEGLSTGYTAEGSAGFYELSPIPSRSTGTETRAVPLPANKCTTASSRI